MDGWIDGWMDGWMDGWVFFIGYKIYNKVVSYNNNIPNIR
jgi:hypothetical protein